MSILRTRSADEVWSAAAKLLPQEPIGLTAEIGRSAAQQVGAVFRLEAEGETWVIKRKRNGKDAEVIYWAGQRLRHYVSLRSDGLALVARLIGPFPMPVEGEEAQTLRKELNAAIRRGLWPREPEAALQERLVELPLPVVAQLDAEPNDPWAVVGVERLLMTEKEAQASLGRYLENIRQILGVDS